MRTRHSRRARWEGGQVPHMERRPPSQRVGLEEPGACVMTLQMEEGPLFSPGSDPRMPTLAPVRALVAAILQRALDDLDLGVSPRARAIAWFRETGTGDEPGSFEWCCGVLDIDPDLVRHRYSSESCSAH